jgi:hypothetical protein
MKILSTFFFCVSLFVVSLSIFNNFANAAQEVVLVQLTHRHGARTPIVPEALAQSVCGDVGCGELNYQGEMMLTALGNYLYDRYAAHTYVPPQNFGHPVAPSADFNVFARNGGAYQVNHMYTRSTDVNRTLQSAAALIRGLSANLTTFYPIIHTTDKKLDTLLLSDNGLSFVLPFNTGNDACINGLDSSRWETTFLPVPKLQAIAAEYKLSSALTCSKLVAGASSFDFSDYADCILPMWDTIMSYIAMGKLTNTSLGVSDVPRMEAFDFMQRTCLFVKTTPQQGAVMYNLVAQYISNMELRARQGSSSSNGGGSLGAQTKLIYHYSAHDTTMAPFMVALGFPMALEPQFGQTMVTELVNETTTGVLTLRHWYGAPQTIWPPADGSVPTPGWYRYNMQEYPVVCWDAAANAIKNTTNGDCTLDEFKLYAEKVLKPTDPAGAQCFLTADMKKKLSCDKATAPESADSACATYRTACPKYACPADFIVNVATLECIPTRFVPVVSNAQAWAVASGTTVGGIVLGVATTFIAKALMTSKQ